MKKPERHGHSRSRISYKAKAYRAWQGMLARCNNPRNKDYCNYGKRGIKVCERWLQFSKFLADMGYPKPHQSIDRKDNDKDYSPENCRWVDIVVQNNNTRFNRLITFENITLSVTQWAKFLGIDGKMFSSRISNGWSFVKAATTRPKITRKFRIRI